MALFVCTAAVFGAAQSEAAQSGAHRGAGLEVDESPGGGPRPNIVLIVADDLGAHDLGCTGSPDARTPCLDRLAAQGLRFDQAYAPCANCAPSRAAIFSGQYAPRTGVYTVGNPARGKARDRRLIPAPNRTELATEVQTFAELLHGAGYRTGFVGKWHLGAGASVGPRGQGFDHNVAGNQAGHPKSYRAPYRNPDLPDGPEGEYLTDRLTDEALAFIRQGGEQPFLLSLSYYAVHTPIQPPKDLAAEAQARADSLTQMKPGYAAMVESLDRNVGRLLDGLEAAGLAGDTVVVFTSDNGGHGGQTSNAPLRGSKGMFYEGGIRVPLFVRWPGRATAGARCEVPVSGTDFLPTFTALAGVELPAQVPAGGPEAVPGGLPEAGPEGRADRVLDGVSLLPLITGEETLAPRALYWHFPAYLEAYAGLKVGPFRTTPCTVMREGPWKLHQYFEDGRVELYHLGEDPGEQQDLASQQVEVRDRLLQQLQAWRQALSAPVPDEPNPAYQPRTDSDGGKTP